jgi:putative flippase GtrA
MDQLKSTKNEIPRFIVTGILAVATDYFGYLALIKIIDVDLSKACSFVLGSIVAFFLNKFWTFESDKKAVAAIMPFIVLYSSTFLINVSLNHFSLVYVTDMKTIAFLIATSASTILNFIGMKFWVFKVHHPQGSY